MGYSVRDQDHFWASGIIPFKVSTGLSESQARRVMSAVNIWNQGSAVDFVPRRGRQEPFVSLKLSNSQCVSPIGKPSGRKLTVECTMNSTGTIVHELGHALGLYHEHQRPDRNKTIEVVAKNIRNSEVAKRDMDRLTGGRSYGTLDQSSVMHYPSMVTNRIARNPRAPVIRSRTRSDPIIGANNTLSRGDVKTLEHMYGRDSGCLVWSRHWVSRTDGLDKWRFTFGRCVGKGWQRYSLLAGAQRHHGAIYAVDRSSGDLMWYRHSGSFSGTKQFTKSTGVKVGSGWQIFSHIMGANNGVIYAIEAKTGKLRWYQHTAARTGAKQWHPESGSVIGTGWQIFADVTCGEDGVIYAKEKSGKLRWYRHMGFDNGSNSWHRNSEQTIGSGWQRFKHILASGSTIYAIEPKGNLHWYQHKRPKSGASIWAEGSGRQLGTGWQIYDQVFSLGLGRIYGRVL